MKSLKIVIFFSLLVIVSYPTASAVEKDSSSVQTWGNTVGNTTNKSQTAVPTPQNGQVDPITQQKDSTGATRVWQNTVGQTKSDPIVLDKEAQITPSEIQVKNESVKAHLQNINAEAEKLKVISETIEDTSRAKNVNTLINQEAEERQIATQKMEKAKKRNGLVTFLFGPDYRSLSDVEEGTKKNQERLQNLNVLGQEIVDNDLKTEFRKTTEVLKQENTKILREIEAQKNQFSLLGWLTKRLAAN